jgi:uncharacterized protein
MNESGNSSRARLTGVLLRAGLFLLFIRVCGGLLGWALYEVFGYLPAAALSIFLAAALATAFVLRVFERAHLASVGMGWSPLSARHLRLGMTAGVLAGVFVVGPPLVSGVAWLEKIADPAAAFAPEKFVFVSVLLLFGAVGEEMMFRGYAFQIVLAALGPWATILPFSVLFAWAHTGNINTTTLGLVNTAMWGLLLGYAFWRSGDLWLPIGLHFGWNWILPLCGANLSGFQLSLSGYALKWKAPALLSGGEYGPEGSILTTVAALLLGLWLWRSGIERQPSLLLHPDSRENSGHDPASDARAIPGAAGRPERQG